MGLLDFLSDVGKDIFGGGDEAEKITEMLNTDLPGRISNLNVGFEDGIVSLSGACDSQATKEKAVLLAGNLKGVKSVQDDNLTAPAAVEETEYYTVKSGDSLSKIAKNYYGDAMKYPLIFEANRPMLKDPDKIYPGQVLRIPPIQA